MGEKKICILICILACLAITGFAFNYGEALQKAVFFYECQVTGPKPAWNRCVWRGDSCMNDYVTGGWYDAGDHVKFGLPMAYTATMLGWAIYEYGDAFYDSGQITHLENNLRFVLDYFAACHQGNQFVYQIGDPGPDHAWWGPIEVIEKKMDRPYYTCDASCVTGQTSAALTLGYLVLGDSTYLTHAQQLFNLADSVRDDSSYSAASGFYSSWSGFWDELMWAAVWLFIATNDNSYLTKAESYIDNLTRQGQDDPRIEFTWTNCWDDCHYGAILLLARLTGKEEYHDFMQMHLDWWTVGYGSDGSVDYTPGGLAWLDEWGCLRYACNTAFIAFVYADMLYDQTLADRYRGFAESQVNYALGDNPRNASYVCGFGVNPPERPHHRTSHGSWCDQQTTPSYHRHILYGALVGGPDSGDGYQDSISDYQMNEVACDYNAAFLGCLAKMYILYGGQPLSGFPEPEIPEDEFFVEAFINSSGNDYTEIKANMNNRSAWPARLLKDLSFNYYIDLSEVFAAGYSLEDITVQKSASEIPTTMSSLTQHSGDIYYFTITFTDGTDIAPIDQTSYEREVAFRISAPNASGCWDPENDYSYQGMTSQEEKTPYIPVYDGGVLIFGMEPGGTEPTPAPTPVSTAVVTVQPTPEPTATPTPQITQEPTQEPGAPGDVNEDGSIDIVDALLVAQLYVGLNPQAFTAPHSTGDANQDGNVDIIDALLIAQYYVGIISQLPPD